MYEERTLNKKKKIRGKNDSLKYNTTTTNIGGGCLGNFHE